MNRSIKKNTMPGTVRTNTSEIGNTSHRSRTATRTTLSLAIAIALVACTTQQEDHQQDHDTQVVTAIEKREHNRNDKKMPHTQQNPVETEAGNVAMPMLVSDKTANDEVVVTGSRTHRAEVDAASPQPLLTEFRRDAAGQSAAQKNYANAERKQSGKIIAALAAPSPVAVDPYTGTNRENYAHVEENRIKVTSTEPVSTFSIDVDTGAYSNMRRMLHDSSLPPQDAIRIEELVNYFSYDYPTPDSTDVPFSVSTELMTTPWNQDTLLMQVGLKGYEIDASERAAANLVFLLDVSGSMSSPDKLPLLQKSFELLTRKLTENDRVSIVVYAGSSGVVLEPTPGDDRRTIMNAIRKLRAGGSTNGAQGIELAYQLAEEAKIDGGINRIILATDGDFNVGTVNFEQLVDMVERERDNGVSLTTLGFGTGNFNDHLMEQLADAGNGNYAYIDSLQEARKVLSSEVTSTLATIAKDVKIQIEFNSDVIAEYRLIGYENRALNTEDFKNDKVDAGEIGAGHTVTALYELTPVGSAAQKVDELRYQQDAQSTRSSLNNEIAFLKLRYKLPNGDTSTEISQPIQRSDIQDNGSRNLRFASAVAAFGQVLKGGRYTETFDYDDIMALADSAIGRDPNGYRSEFLDLVATAQELQEALTPAQDPDGDIAQKMSQAD